MKKLAFLLLLCVAQGASGQALNTWIENNKSVSLEIVRFPDDSYRRYSHTWNDDPDAGEKEQYSFIEATYGPLSQIQHQIWKELAVWQPNKEVLEFSYASLTGIGTNKVEYHSDTGSLSAEDEFPKGLKEMCHFALIDIGPDFSLFDACPPSKQFTAPPCMACEDPSGVYPPGSTLMRLAKSTTHLYSNGGVAGKTYDVTLDYTIYRVETSCPIKNGTPSGTAIFPSTYKQFRVNGARLGTNGTVTLRIKNQDKIEITPIYDDVTDYWYYYDVTIVGSAGPFGGLDVNNGHLIVSGGNRMIVTDDGQGAGYRVLASNDTTGYAGMGFMNAAGTVLKGQWYWQASDNSYHFWFNGADRWNVDSSGILKFPGQVHAAGGIKFTTSVGDPMLKVDAGVLKVRNGGDTADAPISVSSIAARDVVADALWLHQTSGGAFTFSTGGNITSYFVTTSAATVTLQNATLCTGRIFTIKVKTPATSATVATTSSQTIDGATTYALTAQKKYVTVQSDGANWQIIANN